jgi:hypothetical protein
MVGEQGFGVRADLFANGACQSRCRAAAVRCTDEPRSKWLPEEQIRKIFGADQYAIVKFKVTRTNCYEFYAVTQSGQIIEAYYHPITGKLVKENRL